MPAAPSKSKSHSSARQVDLTQEVEDDSLNAIMNNSKAKFPEPTRTPAYAEPAESGWGDEHEDAGEDDDDEGDEDGFDDPFSQNVDEEMTANAEKMKAKKMDILNQLYRLSKEDGVIVPNHISIKTPLDELEAELSK